MRQLRKHFGLLIIVAAVSSSPSHAVKPTPILPPPVSTQPNGSAGIQIILGSFGTLGKSSRLDISAWAQNYCGPSAQSCKLFCSETSLFPVSAYETELRY